MICAIFFPAVWLRKGNPTNELIQTYLNHWSHYPDSWMHQLISSNILSRGFRTDGRFKSGVITVFIQRIQNHLWNN